MHRSCHICVYKVSDSAKGGAPRELTQPPKLLKATKVHTCAGQRSRQALGTGEAPTQATTAAPKPTTTIPSGHRWALRTSSCVASGDCSSSVKAADTTVVGLQGSHWGSFLLGTLVDEGLVDVGDDTTTSNGCLQGTRQRRSMGTTVSASRRRGVLGTALYHV